MTTRELLQVQARGASVVRQLRRYLERADANEIREALYRFLTSQCGFIAHFGLVPPDGGFRIVFSEPAALIEEFLLNHGPSEIRPRATAPTVEFADGMTDLDVDRMLLDLALEHRDCARADADRRRREDELRALHLLADRHELLLIPNHEAAPTGRLFV